MRLCGKVSWLHGEIQNVELEYLIAVLHSIANADLSSMQNYSFS